MSNNRILYVNDSNFEKIVLNREKPVLVDFYADWAAPCKLTSPHMEKIADEFADKVTIAKLNIEEGPDSSRIYNVRSIPTAILFKNGKKTASTVGVDLEGIREMLQKI